MEACQLLYPRCRPNMVQLPNSQATGGCKRQLLGFQGKASCLTLFFWLCTHHRKDQPPRPTKTQSHLNLSALVPGPDADTDTSGRLAAQLLPWLESTLSGLNGGMRRYDNELVIGYINFPAAGVPSSYKTHFCLSQVTQLASSMTKSFVAVVVMPNRAADLRAGTKSSPQSLPSALFVHQERSN